MRTAFPVSGTRSMHSPCGYYSIQKSSFQYCANVCYDIHIISNQEKFKTAIADFDLRLVVLFGSQAKGKTHRTSDVDVAVMSSRPLDIEKKARLQIALAEAFGRPDIEVADIRGASPLLLREITKNGRVLHADDPDVFARLRMYAFKIYVETKPLREYGRAHLNRFIKSNG